MTAINEWFVATMLEPTSNKQQAFSHACSKVICVGRNYVEHAKELNNPVPTEPLLFIKPNSCLVELAAGITLPSVQSSCQHELEVAILMGRKAQKISAEDSFAYVAGIGVGLDLTLRELQTQLKSKGQPWEKAKAFDGACPISDFIPMTKDFDFDNIDFSLEKNGQIVQSANTTEMIFSIRELIAYVSDRFTLYPGDMLMTGTPSGVAELAPGDRLKLTLNQQSWTTLVR